jgi:hypothetical protein
LGQGTTRVAGHLLSLLDCAGRQQPAAGYSTPREAAAFKESPDSTCRYAENLSGFGDGEVIHHYFQT